MQQNIGRDFILAGRAIFTMVGRDARFTYRVSKKEEPGRAPVYFVGLLTGPNNEADYSYLGVLDPVTGYVRLTRKSRMTLNAPAVRALQWALPKVWASVAMPPSFSLMHVGRCGRCGRTLTVPESIATGIGPDCAEQMGIPMAVIEKAARPARVAPRPDPTLYGLDSGRYDGLDPFRGGEEAAEEPNLEAALFDAPLELTQAVTR